MHPTELDHDQLLSECVVRRQRRSGPGGQHRNKVETGVFLTHEPTGLRAEATEQRSQPRNLALAIHRLRMRLAVAVRCDERSSTASTLWLSRLHGSRIHVSPNHDDFPALLAEALDMLAARDWEPKRAAESLRCSASQLLKFIKREPSAWTELNKQRLALGRPPLR